MKQSSVSGLEYQNGSIGFVRTYRKRDYHKRTLWRKASPDKALKIAEIARKEWGEIYSLDTPR